MNSHDMKIIEQQTQTFLTDVQNSVLLEYILKDKENIVCAYVTGSRATGLATEKSDIDINILRVQQTPVGRYWNNEQAIYKYNDTQNLKVQWFPQSLEEFITTFKLQGISQKLQISGAFQWALIEDKNIFYINEKYQYIFDNLKQLRTRLAIFSIYRYTKAYLKLIQHNHVQEWINYKSIVARLCYMADWIKNNNQFNISHLDIYRDIKRGTVKPHLNFIKESFDFLLEYIQNNPLNIEKETQELIDLIYKGGINYAKNN